VTDASTSAPPEPAAPPPPAEPSSTGGTPPVPEVEPPVSPPLPPDPVTPSPPGPVAVVEAPPMPLVLAPAPPALDPVEALVISPSSELPQFTTTRQKANNAASARPSLADFGNMALLRGKCPKVMEEGPTFGPSQANRGVSSSRSP